MATTSETVTLPLPKKKRPFATRYLPFTKYGEATALFFQMFFSPSLPFSSLSLSFLALLSLSLPASFCYEFG